MATDDSAREAELAARLLDRISREGSLSFSDFMREALYHPRHGFYSAPGRVGREGDFFTSVSVGSLMGELLGSWLIERVADLGDPESFVIVEQGADSGHLCSDILSFIRLKAPDLFAALTYLIIEPLGPLREVQRGRLEKSGLLDKVGWADSPESVRHPVGIFLTNELVDSFPVDLVCFTDGQWRERRVGMSRSGEMVFDDSTPAPKACLKEIERWGIPEVEGYCAEIHLEAAAWIHSAAATLERGFFLTIDYGYSADRLYAPGRCDGTLQAYRDHRRSNNLLASPGCQDLTAHVNFDLLKDEGARAGLTTVSFQDQHHFLVEIARQGWLQEVEEGIQANPDHPGMKKKIREFQSLMHPEMMGTTFHCLVQRKR